MSAFSNLICEFKLLRIYNFRDSKLFSSTELALKEMKKIRENNLISHN